MLKKQNVINNNCLTFDANSYSKNKKLIFLVHKRSHSNDKLESNNDSNKSVIYRKHDRNEKDNILTKIQIHYRNFLVEFINIVIIKIMRSLLGTLDMCTATQLLNGLKTIVALKLNY